MLRAAAGSRLAPASNERCAPEQNADSVPQIMAAPIFAIGIDVVARLQELIRGRRVDRVAGLGSV
jgi:hypothetical protein